MAATQDSLIEKIYNDRYKFVDFSTVRFTAITQEIKRYICSNYYHKLIDCKTYNNPSNSLETVEDIIIFLPNDKLASIAAEFDDIKQPIILETSKMAVVSVFEISDGKIVDTNVLALKIKTSINEEFRQVIYMDGIGKPDTPNRWPSGIIFFVPLRDIKHFEDLVNGTENYICMSKQIGFSIIIETSEQESFNKLIRNLDVRILDQTSLLKHSSKIKIDFIIPIDIGFKIYGILLASPWIEINYFPSEAILSDNIALINHAKQSGNFIRTILMEKNENKAIEQLRADIELRNCTLRVSVRCLYGHNMHRKFEELIPVIDGYCYITPWQLACMIGSNKVLHYYLELDPIPESVDKNVLEMIDLFIARLDQSTTTFEFFAAQDSSLTLAAQQMRLLYLCFGQIFSDILPPGVSSQLLSSIIDDAELLKSQSSAKQNIIG
ncbi:hypothetical protein Lmor_2312 [Legionella moravica]|uniref:Uncharacterized protein n=1 Tax=Legionella moravica TaxID=39962 RepID=A0A378JZL9_9GAMM|nr:hypothetical protein [Legionella moravica]KTD32374.1 hypothetical protein Lmor_2312 [Legionella moravica]STX62469.1 Uncharacterised protein [Legionella moravica]